MATSFDLSSALAFLELVWQNSTPRRVATLLWQLAGEAVPDDVQGGDGSLIRRTEKQCDSRNTFPAF